MSQPQEHQFREAVLRAGLKQERAAVHNAVARAERAENALKKALARVEELETALQGVLAATQPLTRKPWMTRAGNPPQTPTPCPEWPDCGDDEAPCMACAEYADFLELAESAT